jgi:hypothetical protein
MVHLAKFQNSEFRIPASVSASTRFIFHGKGEKCASGGKCMFGAPGVEWGFGAMAPVL